MDVGSLETTINGDDSPKYCGCPKPASQRIAPSHKHTCAHKYTRGRNAPTAHHHTDSTLASRHFALGPTPITRPSVQEQIGIVIPLQRLGPAVNLLAAAGELPLSWARWRAVETAVRGSLRSAELEDPAEQRAAVDLYRAYRRSDDREGAQEALQRLSRFWEE